MFNRAIEGHGLCSKCTADASLVHPCPAHPAVEQVGGDERAAFEAAFAAMGRPVCRADYDPDAYGTPFDDGGWTGWQARAALAQPSPAQAEAERPEVVARVDGTDEDWFIQPEDETELHSEGLLFAGCELGRMIDFDHIVGALRADRDSWAEQAEQRLADWDEMRKERDAALVEVERLRESKGDPVGSLEKCMKVMYERDEHAKRLEVALARVAELEGKLTDWVHEGFRLNEALAVAQAQHSVPEISGIGRDAEHPRAVVLYLRNEPSDEDMRAIQNFLRAMPAAAPTKAQHSVPDVCDGKEQNAFEDWASKEGMNMERHPLHWLFLDAKTYSARQGWKAALKYACNMLA
ncbi:TPA: hypothetical protein ACMFP1_002959, partial [Pseudomonas aeruginosa]